jgi:hypothetical protein
MAVNGTEVNGSVNGGTPRPWAQPRGVGRPSTVAPFAPQIEAWLRETPALSGADVLRRAREVGYQGGKSALYELVRRLRMPHAAGHVGNGHGTNGV